MPTNNVPCVFFFFFLSTSIDTGKLDFESFCRVALHFNEEVDEEALQKELKEAFRLYDKEGKYILNDMHVSVE